MAIIEEYCDLEEKQEKFQNRDYFIINTKKELDSWLGLFPQLLADQAKKDNSKISPVDCIYRGVNEAKYKLYTSAQRVWIKDNISSLEDGYTYLKFIKELVKEAKKGKLLKDVFDLYGYNKKEKECVTLCILQHYGGVTPLLDWTYEFAHSLYFATDGVSSNDQTDDINNYISIYAIYKKYSQERPELMLLQDILKGFLPSIDDIMGKVSKHKNSNRLYLLTDFEKYTERQDVEFKDPSKGFSLENCSSSKMKPYGKSLRIKTKKPYTSLFNQNIIAQKGLMMFNPYPDRPVEELFNVPTPSDGQNLELEPFYCFNIRKDLVPYLKRLIPIKYYVTKNTIYPDLNSDMTKIMDSVLDSVVKRQEKGNKHR